MLKQTLCVLFALSISLSPSLSVPYGENCHPLVPDLACDAESGLSCVQQFDGMYRCLCGPGRLINADERSCAKTYDELCYYEPGGGCNTDRGLYCQKAGVVLPYGDCVCSGMSENVWDWERDLCVGLASATCDPATQHDEFGDGCVAYATCDADSRVCVCNPGYEEREDRRCVKIAGGPGDACDYHQDCDWTNLHLECGSSGVCECASSRGYHSQKNGTCVKGFGQTCSSVDPCDSEKYQRCSSHSATPGTCVCKSSLIEYNNITDECAAIIGSTCGDNDLYNPGIGCIANAECVLPNDTSVLQCQCTTGYIPSIDNRECVRRPN